MTTYMGSVVRIAVTFRNDAGVLTDPDDVTLTIRDPDGAMTTVSNPTNDSVGVWHHDVLLDNDGRWSFRWQGEGTLTTAIEMTHDVERSSFDT